MKKNENCKVIKTDSFAKNMKFPVTGKDSITALVIFDRKKFMPIRHREAQLRWFGKPGLSFLGFMTIYLGKSGYYDALIEGYA